MTIYFIVTTSVYNSCPIRKNQYIKGIETLKRSIQSRLTPKDYRILIVENNGKRNTFLDGLGCEVFYTENNFLPTNNRGYKELQDILDSIQTYSIQDTDFIVKMTGRYILDDDDSNRPNEFINTIQSLHHTKYNCIIKYGSYSKPDNNNITDCITGLIGMRCFYVKQIKYPTERECVEWKWADATRHIHNKDIYKVNKLGIYICPGSNEYFLV